MVDQFYKGENWLKPLVQAWREKKQQASKARDPWLGVARECRRFYAGGASWMWDERYRRDVWGGDPPSPTWKLSVNKCFEFVSIYLPFLWSNLPHRLVEPKRAMDFDPALLFGPPPQVPPQAEQAAQQGDPQAQQMMMQAQQYQQQVQQYQQQSHMEKSTDEARADLMMRWLNYTTKEQPDGGLYRHGELCCLDALITGRGVMWPTPYRMPGSQRTLTKCVWRPVTDFYTDPDYDTWQEGGYVMRETTMDVAAAEERFGLPKGSLRRRGGMESRASFAERAGDYRSDADRKQGHTKDQITFTEIWSKVGVGCRWTAMEPAYRDHLDRVVGKYAYIAISDDVPWPLNAPVDAFSAGAKDEDVKNMFRWAVPFWTDGRWPCSVLDFWHDIPLKEEGDERGDRTKFRGWPVSPMGPGIGLLKFVNAAISFLTGRIVTSCRDFWAVMKPALEELEGALERGGDQQVIPINRIHGKISDVLTIIQQPETRQDVWKIIDAALQMLDKQWHVSPLMYGQSGPTQERSATEVVEKRQAMQVVPEFMAKKVEAQQTELAVQEAFCAIFFVSPEDVLPLMGPAGAHLWQKLIKSEDPEVMLRQMRYVIGSGTIRRPNRDKLAADFNSMMQTFGPLFQQYFGATGDPRIINESIEEWGDINERDTAHLMLPPPPPPQPPPVDPMEQQKMQLEMQKLQADVQLKQMELQGKQAETQSKMQLAGLKLQGDQQKLQLDTTKAGMDLQQDQQGFIQDLTQDRLSHVQTMRHDQQKHEQEMEQTAAKAKADVAAKRAVVKAGPSNGNGKG